MDDLARLFSLQQAFGPQQDLATMQQLFGLAREAQDMQYGGLGGMADMGMDNPATAGLSPAELAAIQQIQSQLQGRGF